MAAIVLAVLLAVASPAAAQDVPTDRMEEGRALYEAGLIAAEAERWADAERNFRRAYRLTRSAAALFNLALAHRALGQPVDAVAALDELLARSDLETELRERASRLRAVAAEEIAELVLIGLSNDRRYEVALDQRLVADEGERPLTIAVDPGARTLVVRRDLERWRWEGELSAGERRTVEPFTAPPDGSIFASPWLWVITGVVVVGAVTTTVLLLSDDGIEPRSGRYVPL